MLPSKIVIDLYKLELRITGDQGQHLQKPFWSVGTFLL